MDKYINTIIEINIEHNYSKYHIKIHKKQQDYHKILTTKKHKNQYKQHSTIIAIDIENTIIETLPKKIISRMIYNYRYNYRALYIDVSRETIKIIYIRIYRRVYIYI